MAGVRRRLRRRRSTSSMQVRGGRRRTRTGRDGAASRGGTAQMVAAVAARGVAARGCRPGRSRVLGLLRVALVLGLRLGRGGGLLSCWRGTRWALPAAAELRDFLGDFSFEVLDDLLDLSDQAALGRLTRRVGSGVTHDTASDLSWW
jgi:hypothetical protein